VGRRGRGQREREKTTFLFSHTDYVTIFKYWKQSFSLTIVSMLCKNTFRMDRGKGGE
jgi:hypothetical protein